MDLCFTTENIGKHRLCVARSAIQRQCRSATARRRLPFATLLRKRMSGEATKFLTSKNLNFRKNAIKFSLRFFVQIKQETEHFENFLM